MTSAKEKVKPVKELTKEEMEEFEDKGYRLMSNARSGMLLGLKQPFYGMMAMHLQLRHHWGMPTCATDGKFIYFNPMFVCWMEDKKEDLRGVYLHEILHAVLCHPFRIGQRNIKKWQLATDYAVNGIIKEAEIALPEWVLYDPKWLGMSADEIYAKLPDENEESCDGSGDGSGDGDDHKDCGCSGVMEPISEETGKPLSEAEKQLAEQSMKEEVAATIVASKSQGDLPASLTRMFDELLHPKVPWHTQLRQFMIQHTNNDYDWSKPNRRHLSAGFILPGIHSEEMGDICIIIDTSGSVGIEQLTQFMSEVNDIVQFTQTGTVYVIYVDAQVSGWEEFSSDDRPIRAEVKGGGGTDFRPGFDWIEQQGITPCCTIYFTDGFCNSFPDEPDYPCLWLVYKGYENFEDIVPFGEIVSMD